MIGVETAGADPTLLGVAAVIAAILGGLGGLGALILILRNHRGTRRTLDVIARSVNHVDEEPDPADGPQTLGQLVRAGFKSIDDRLDEGDKRFARLEESQRRVEHEVRNVRQVQMNMIETGAGDLWRLTGRTPPLSDH